MDRGVLSKFTFGFLMAQLFPGAIAVYAITLAYVSCHVEVNDVCELSSVTYDRWFSSSPSTVTFLFLAVGVGMLIHGIDWTVLAWLENHESGKELSARDSFWHCRPIVLQIILGPVKMATEILWLLGARGIDRLLMDENAPSLDGQHMPVFNFLQDFYLHFGQFYAHTAYALVVCFACTVIAVCSVGFSFPRVGLIAITYCLAGVFFLIGRVQLGSLFVAEKRLRERAETGRSSTGSQSDMKR